MKAAIFFCAVAGDTLSVFVKTRTNGSDLLVSHCTNSRSICCGGKPDSMSAKTLQRFVRCSK